MQRHLFLQAQSKLETILSKAWQVRPPICESIKEWCQQQPSEIAQVLHPDLLKPQRVQRNLPQTIESQIHPVFHTRAKNYSPEKYLAHIHGTQLIGRNGSILLPDGHYATEPFMCRSYLEELPEYYGALRNALYSKTRKRGNYYTLLQIHARGSNYYHWMHDVLQRLYLILPLLPQDIRFIVPDGLKAWQIEALGVLGISESQLEFYSGNEIWQIDSLYFSPLTAVLGYDTLGANEWVRQVFYDKYAIHAQSLKRNQRIFISRSRTSGRRIDNEIEIFSILETFGFKRYFLETMSLQEQVQLFARAEAVVASHGAGLTNLMFAQPGTHVLEIFEPSGMAAHFCFWSLCHAMQHNYWYLLGETRENPAMPGHLNIAVSCEKLSQALAHLVSI